MVDVRETVGKECIKEHIVEIGQDLINRAEEIAKDIDQVREIKINATLTPHEIICYNVTKTYGVNRIEN